MDFSIKDLDWRSQLIKRYRYYGINENDLVVIFCISDALSNFDFLVTADDLLTYMTLSREEIDSVLVKLLDKKLIEYISKDSKTVTSLEPLFKKIVADLKKDIILESKDSSKKRVEPIVNSLYQYFEEVMGKPLSSREVDRISSWIRYGADERMIHEAVEKLKAQKRTVSIPAVDKIILALQKNRDINKEGFSPRKEEWRDGPEETMRIISEPWVPHD